MKRREFIKWGTGGLAAIVLNQTLVPRIFRDFTAQAATVPVELTVVDALKEMVDKTQVFHYAYANAAFGPRVPGPVIVAAEGDTITVTLNNASAVRHGFKIPGVVTVRAIPPGGSRTFSFTAPPAGSYLYFDHVDNPVNRVLGLYGALVVKPVAGNTPYSNPSPKMQRLFNDLGTAAHFPGRPWAPSGPDNREHIWLFSQVDPAFNALAEQGETIAPQLLRRDFLPRYFMINGRSGAYAAHDIFQDEIDRGYALVPHDFIGRPYLIRMMNAGIFGGHSPHLHGNHYFVLARNGKVRPNVHFVDTYTLAELARVDILIPFIRPPDIPGPKDVPLRDLIPEELAALPRILRTDMHELGYPMHSHEEQTQTAAGGNYPQGAVTHGMVLIGDVDGVPFGPQEEM